MSATGAPLVGLPRLDEGRAERERVRYEAQRARLQLRRALAAIELAEVEAAHVADRLPAPLGAAASALREIVTGLRRRREVVTAAIEATKGFGA